MERTVITVSGPTATGKTRLGIELALELGGEIVSADSMQVYRRMDIGTAKATAEERSAVPHHMLDVAEPWEDYSVARYVAEAARCCEEIFSRGRIPVIVGGTGLYIDSLLSGRDFAERSGENAVRERLNAEYDELGGEELHRRLASFDPERAAKLHPSDKRRIVRAIEVYELTGMTITAHDELTRTLPPRYRAAHIILGYADRAELYRRIDSRVDKMVEDGLYGEVRSLLAEGVPPDCTAMQAIGYKEPAAALRGELTEAEANGLIKQSSRRYAKRQLTWFNRTQDALRIRWEKTPDFEMARRISSEYLRRFGLS